MSVFKCALFPGCNDVHTNNHDVEIEPLANTLAMPLVWKVGETNKPCQLSANDVPHFGRGGRGSLGVSRGNSLRYRGVVPAGHGIAAGHNTWGRGRFAIGHLGCGRRCTNRCGCDTVGVFFDVSAFLRKNPYVKSVCACRDTANLRSLVWKRGLLDPCTHCNRERHSMSDLRKFNADGELAGGRGRRLTYPLRAMKVVAMCL